MPVISGLLLWPLIEIVLFVVIGGRIGVLATLLWVIGTAAFGIMLLRRQGMRSSLRMGRNLPGAIMDLGRAGFSMLAALLLILPGFLTDILGLLLLLPPVQIMIAAALARKVSDAAMRSDSATRRADGIVIDGEFVEIDAQPPKRPSGWTQH